MKKWLKSIICKYFGHKWSETPLYIGFKDGRMIKSKECLRCSKFHDNKIMVLS